MPETCQQKRQLEGWVFSQVEAYEIFHAIVWQWKEELFCKSRKLLVPVLRRSTCVGKVFVVQASYGASPLGAPGNRPKSQAGFTTA